jgi:hypothetical protein
LNRDDKRAPHDGQEDEDDGESHAADEPTAVWDESAMRAAGLTDLIMRHQPERPLAPATPATHTGDPSIVIDQSLVAKPAPAVQSIRAAPMAPRAGLSWAATLGIAIVLGGLMYLVIRLVRG